jgi:hypothetical protein
VRLLAYLGVIALLSMAGAHFSKSPKVMGAITPVHQGWIDIERPFAAFVVPVGKFPLRDRFTSQENATSTPMVNAIDKLGQSQTSELIFNPGGDHNNVMQNIRLNA